MAGALDGITVLDLSRVLAGPTCTQLLGDLGARVIKVENPATGGDDTRAWGPPFARGPDGVQTELSAYFLSSNRNKLSVALDLASPEGRQATLALAGEADVVIENFRPGALARHGLDHATLLGRFPRLVYCSISGFGQTGPNAAKPGYDILAQGFGGIMSLTGEPDGEPMKVGVAVADVVCGLYAATGILAALRHRDATGEGQHIDLALADSQVAWLINQGAAYLATGDVPERHGNAHPSIVPYQVFEASDGHVIVAVGNDAQFRRFAEFLGLGGLADVPDYATNPARLANRSALLAEVAPRLRAMTRDEIISGLEARLVPAGPVNGLDRVFDSEQVRARDMTVRMRHPELGGREVALIGNPLKFSRTPVSYRLPPPRFGQDTAQVLSRLNLKKN
jgi:crotonobetainyl-CoA:carnitine CoA-transferase CaiB-like acyl-CoA transferase